MQRTNKKSKSKKVWWITVACVIIIALVYFNFKWDIYVRYYNLSNNHFKHGDRVYASTIFEKKINYSIYLWRVIEPSNKNSNLVSYVISCNKFVIKDSLLKHKTAFIGNYLKHKILNVKIDNGRIVPFNFYALKPNKMVVFDTGIDNGKMPQGYIWADSTLYVIALDLTNQELKKFRT